MLGVGLVGLIVLTILSFVSAGRGSAQVAASGQALMQSQRLAKSVSQALTGNPAAFPEVKESADVLASNVRGLKNGDGDVAAAPSGVQDALDAAVPLVDRAEKSAGVVLAQQKALTEVGQSLRAINRQSVDLLEASEAILSLKLQRDTSPTEVSALGQLVMLTQRIGKSANEFLTAEGVNPEAVVLLSKDLNSFNEITKGLLDGNPQMGLPGTRDPQVRERLIALNKLYQETRTRGGVILDNLAGLNAAREAQNTIIGDSEPLRKDLETRAGQARQRDRLQRPDAGDAAAVRDPGDPRRRRLPAPVRRGAGPARRARADRRLEAEGQEKEAKRVNDANQAAILAADERAARRRRRRPDAAGDGHRGHHRRDRRLGQLHRRGAAHAGLAGAGHGRPRDRDDRAGRGQFDRAARDLVRAAARDPRHRRVGAADGRPDQQRVDAGAGNRAGRAPVAAGGRVRA